MAVTASYGNTFTGYTPSSSYTSTPSPEDPRIGGLVNTLSAQGGLTDAQLNANVEAQMAPQRAIIDRQVANTTQRNLASSGLLPTGGSSAQMERELRLPYDQQFLAAQAQAFQQQQAQRLDTNRGLLSSLTDLQNGQRTYSNQQAQLGISQQDLELRRAENIRQNEAQRLQTQALSQQIEQQRLAYAQGPYTPTSTTYTNAADAGNLSGLSGATGSTGSSGTTGTRSASGATGGGTGSVTGVFGSPGAAAGFTGNATSQASLDALRQQTIDNAPNRPYTPTASTARPTTPTSSGSVSGGGSALPYSGQATANALAASAGAFNWGGGMSTVDTANPIRQNPYGYGVNNNSMYQGAYNNTAGTAGYAAGYASNYANLAASQF